MQDEWTQICDSDIDIGNYVDRENVHVEIKYQSDGRVVQDSKMSVRISIFKVNKSMNEDSIKQKIIELTNLHLTNNEDIQYLIDQREKMMTLKLKKEENAAAKIAMPKPSPPI